MRGSRLRAPLSHLEELRVVVRQVPGMPVTPQKLLAWSVCSIFLTNEANSRLREERGEGGNSPPYSCTQRYSSERIARQPFETRVWNRTLLSK